MISGLVLTYNEERILAKCLSSLNFVDELVVFDSFSNDGTLEIAQEFNARIIQRKFDNYASQRNAALASMSEDTDWIVMVDADEIVTPELRQEILGCVTKQNDLVMYRVRRKDMFQDKWIKHASGYPTWFPRVFTKGAVEVVREINEEYLAKGPEGKLEGHLIHYPFNKGLSYWFEKHTRYAQMEAERMLVEIKEPLNIYSLFSVNPVERRKAQKRLSYQLPFRSWFVFTAFYLFKGGFLDGKAGYEFCKLRKTYEDMIASKFKELKNSKA